jgi:hypothetical protein
MPFPPFAPSVYFEDADIDALVAEFSERIRRSATLRPAMAVLVGNRWEDAEVATGAFLRATLFLEQRPDVDAEWLARSVATLDEAALDELGDLLLDCALVVLPLHSAAVISAIGDELGHLLGSVVAGEGDMRQRLLLRAEARLAAGALMNRF